jgi:hypothetical protein
VDAGRKHDNMSVAHSTCSEHYWAVCTARLCHVSMHVSILIASTS